jgi:serine/threonine protein kinase
VTPQEAVTAVEAAINAGVLLGTTPDQRHKELKVLLHPDRFGRDETWARRAEAAIYKLDTLYASVSTAKVSRAVKIGEWVITDPVAKGDIADLYHAESDSRKGILKLAQKAIDNDLMKNEREVLEFLHKPADVPSVQFRQYLPSILDVFSASGRAANVLSPASGFLTLADICRLVTVDFRHVVWMMNRALSILGYIHLNKVVHGAITPAHLLYDPANHNLCLVDWCYASRGIPIKAVVKAHRDNYPPEIFRKAVPSPSTDLFMLAKVLHSVADVPKRFRPLFDLCTIQSPSSRPQSAWNFQDRWRKAAEEEYGPARFVPLVLPVQ